MKYPAYPKYKDSGVEWLGEVPEHWEVKAVWHSYFLGRGRVISHEDISDNPGEYPVYSSQTENDGVLGCLATYDFEGDYITWTTDGANAGTVFRRTGKFNCTNVCGTLFPKSIADNIFCMYCLNNATKEFVRHDINPKLMNNVMAKIRIPYPPLSEQRAIAAFLDAQTSKFDTLIAKKRELIAKLKEKRAALITRTVTRGLPPDAAKAAGLNPHPKMKDSGVEWLGEVPEHWDVKRLKHHIQHLNSGASVNSDNMPTEDDSPGILKTSCVYGDVFRPEENKKVVEEELDRVFCPTIGDSLVISRMNTPDLVGSCGYVSQDWPHLFLPDRLWITQFADKNKSFPKFFWYRIISRDIKEQISSLATGTSGSMKNLMQDSFLNIAVAIPLLPEQHAIAAYLDHETAAIDALVAKVETAIARLQEYRAALITAAVTGRIDVREAVQ